MEEDAPWPSLSLNLLHIHSFPMCPLLIHHKALVGVGACGVGVWCPLWCQMWVWVCAGNGWWVWTWVWVGGAVSVGSSHNAAGGVHGNSYPGTWETSPDAPHAGA